MTTNRETPDTGTPPVVDQYFAEHPDILDVELTKDNTAPRTRR
ncbi:hypothetical protein ACT3SZ_03735 [Corynebacterium sp. AOP40-9SA-29]